MNSKRMHQVRSMFVYALVGFVGCNQTVSAAVRTWTSVSGTTLEAELVRVEAGRAVLRSANGNEVSISLSKLSEGDQAYLKNSTTGASTVAESTVPVSAPALNAKTNLPVGALFPSSDVQSLTGGVPETIKLRRPEDAKFILIQYGPDAVDVLYVVLDPPGPQVATDALYAWSPVKSGAAVPRRIAGKSQTMLDAKAYVMEIPVATKFGDRAIRGTIQVVSGVQEWWLIHVSGNYEIVQGGKSSSFRVGGYVNDYAVDPNDAQNAKPIRLLSDFLFRIVSHAENGLTSGEFKMGEFNFIPGKNMKNEIKLRFTDAKGSKAEDHTWKISDEHLLKAGHDVYFQFIPKALKSGTAYTAKGTIDLGPVFGVKTAEATFTLK